MNNENFPQTSLRAAILLALAAGTPAAQAAAPAPGVALGDQFQVSSFSAGYQPKGVVVAADAAGDFVIVWTSYDQAASDSGDDIYAQRYHADGTTAGTGFRVNTTIIGRQSTPAVAMDAAGDFVVTWEDYGGAAGNSTGIFAQRYHANGTTDGTQFRVNMATSGGQESPSVAIDAAGDFVIAWSNSTWGATGSENGIFARRYSVDDATAGSEFRVNMTTSGTWRSPSVAIDAAGDFVIAWHSYVWPSDHINARRYSADGTPASAELEVATGGSLTPPSTAMDATGAFVVTWADGSGADGDGYGIFARRYPADGPAGPGFPVNTITAGDQMYPTAAMDASGDLVVSWAEYEYTGAYGYDSDVFARRFHADGTTAGAEFQVNTTTAGDQNLPWLATDAAGDLVVVWMDENDPYSYYGDVFARRYARESSLDIKSTLALAPAGTVEPGGGVTLTAGIDNVEAPATPTGNDTVDSAVAAASGLTATLTFPDGITFGKATGTGWTCPAAPTDHKLTCTYAATLAAATASETLTISVTAPHTEGAKLVFGNAVFGAQPDMLADNNTATAAVAVKTPSSDDNGSGNNDNDAGGNGSADDDPGDNNPGSGMDGNPPYPSSSWHPWDGGYGGFGLLGFGLLGLPLLVRRRRRS